MLTITRLPAVEGFTALQERMNRLFEEFFGETAPGTDQGWTPALDVLETPESLLVTLDVPGVDPKSIDVSVAGETLEIAGEKPEQVAPKDGRWYRFERRTGSFRRRIPLPFPVDADRIEAAAEHGVLQVRAPKKPEVMAKRIAVKAK